MGKFLLGVVVGALALFVYDRQIAAHGGGATQSVQVADESGPVESPTDPADRPDAPAATQYRCDGRKYCSQMSSCEEATFFLQNCPGTEMDGDNDGEPCEKQCAREADSGRF